MIFSATTRFSDVLAVMVSMWIAGTDIVSYANRTPLLTVAPGGFKAEAGSVVEARANVMLPGSATLSLFGMMNDNHGVHSGALSPSMHWRLRDTSFMLNVDLPQARTDNVSTSVNVEQRFSATSIFVRAHWNAGGQTIAAGIQSLIGTAHIRLSASYLLQSHQSEVLVGAAFGRVMLDVWAWVSQMPIFRITLGLRL